MEIEQDKEIKLAPAEKDRLDIELGTEKGDKAGTHVANLEEKGLVDLAAKQYESYHEHYKDEIAMGKEDLAFRGGDHWTVDGVDYKAKRTAEGKLSLTKNRAPGFIDNVTGEVRQNMPRIKFRPMDSKTDPMLADIYNAGILYTQSVSRAHRQIIPAFEQACTSGYPGWVQILTDYVDPEVSDEQDILFRFIPSQFGPALDHTAIVMDEPGKGGPKWGHIPEKMTWADFNDRFPTATAKSWDAVKDAGNSTLFDQDGPTILSYYKAVPTQETRVDFNIGGAKSSFLKSSDEYATFVSANPEAKPVKERAFTKWRIDHYLMTGTEILKGPEPWPGKFVPLIPLEGKYFIADGKKQYSSVFRDAKDANRMENWTSSELIELMADEPYIADPDMVEEHKTMWESRNKKQYGVLYAKQVGGAFPKKEDNGQKIQGMFRIIPQMIDDEKALTNIFNASRGEQGNETSGRAINARAQQSNQTNFAFMDNGIIAPHEYIGMQYVDLFPKVFDYEKTLKIIGEDDRDNGEVTINKTVPVQGAGGIAPGVMHEHKNKKGTVKQLFADLKDVRFNITVDVGPGMKTQRMEAADNMIRMSQGNPVFAEAASGQVAKMLDFTDADKIAERAEFILNVKYPGIDQVGQDNDPANPQAKTAQAVTAAVEQVKQQMMPMMKQSADTIEQLQTEMQKKDQDAQALQGKIDMATNAMKDAASKAEIRAQEFDLQLRELKLESENELFKSEAEKEMLRVQAEKAGLDAQQAAMNNESAKAIAGLQAQLDALTAARKDEMAQIMAAIEKDDAEKGNSKEHEGGEKGAEALATLTEEIRKIATRPIEITMKQEPRGPMKAETRDKNGEIIRTTELKEE